MRGGPGCAGLHGSGVGYQPRGGVHCHQRGGATGLTAALPHGLCGGHHWDPAGGGHSTDGRPGGGRITICIIIEYLIITVSQVYDGVWGYSRLQPAILS